MRLNVAETHGPNCRDRPKKRPDAVVTSGPENHVTLNPLFTISDRGSSAMECTTGGPIHRIDTIDRRRGHRSRTAKCTRLNGLQERETVHKFTDCCRVRRRVCQKGSSNLRSFCCGLMVGLNKTGCRPHPDRILQTIFALSGITENRRSTKSLNPHSDKETSRQPHRANFWCPAF